MLKSCRVVTSTIIASSMDVRASGKILYDRRLTHIRPIFSQVRESRVGSRTMSPECRTDVQR